MQPAPVVRLVSAVPTGTLPAAVGADGSRTAQPSDAPHSGRCAADPTRAGSALRNLVPVYASLALDAVSVGLLLPLLPFYMNELGATPVDVSGIISTSYAAQAVGALAMGQLADAVGRKAALQLGLLLSLVSSLVLSRARSLQGVLLSRVLAASSGGVMPMVQACVLEAVGADPVMSGSQSALLGRVQAAYCAGFIAGPLLSVALYGMSPRAKALLAASFPFIGLLAVSFLFTAAENRSGPLYKPESPAQEVSEKGLSITPLLVSSFFVMAAFSNEGVYPVVLKQYFGFEERALALIMIASGVAVLLLQLSAIPFLVDFMGPSRLLMYGNALLSTGLLGTALVRSKEMAPLSVAFFIIHVLGFALSDTSIVSLISRHPPLRSRSKNLSWNQATQSAARIVSPLLSGFIFVTFKDSEPGLVGSLCLAVSAALPTIASAAVWAAGR